jgi:hypothetical protein
MLWKDRNSIYYNSHVNVIKFRNLMQIMQIYKDDRKRYSILIGVCVTWSLVLCVMFCRSLFVLLSYFFWPLCCLFFLYMVYWLIDWLVLNGNFSSISSILWHENILYINFDTYNLCILFILVFRINIYRGHRGHDRMIVGLVHIK